MTVAVELPPGALVAAETELLRVGAAAGEIFALPSRSLEKSWGGGKGEFLSVENFCRIFGLLHF